MNYKYVRVLISGVKYFRFTPEMINVLSENNFKYIDTNTFKAINISLFHEEDPKFEGLMFSGGTDIVDASPISDETSTTFYEGLLVEARTGLIRVRDRGRTDASGILEFSNKKANTKITGQFVSPPIITTYSDEYGNIPIYPIQTLDNRFEFPTLGDIISPKRNVYLDNPQSIGVERKYSGEFSGYLEFNNYFYDSGKKSVTFSKKVPYKVRGDQSPVYEFIVINLGPPGQDLLPGAIVLNEFFSKGSGLVTGFGNFIVTGTLLNVPVPRGNLQGFSDVIATVTGNVLGNDSGIFRYDQNYSTSVASAYQTQMTGGLYSSGILRYRNPVEGDTIVLENTKDEDLYYSFTYEPNANDFTPPLYFNNIQTLNTIINSNSNYGINSTIINLNSLGYPNESGLLIKSIALGENGNNFTITNLGSSNAPILLNGTFLTGGVSYYASLNPTGIYIGRLATEMNPTGIFVTDYQGNIYGQMNKTIGFKTFTGIWQMFGTTDDITIEDIKDYNNIETGKIYSVNTPTGFNSENIYLLKINYINNSKSTDIDEAVLKIYRNNIEETGIILRGLI